VVPASQSPAPSAGVLRLDVAVGFSTDLGCRAGVEFGVAAQPEKDLQRFSPAMDEAQRLRPCCRQAQFTADCRRDGFCPGLADAPH
jgi:hypothetical protein